MAGVAAELLEAGQVVVPVRARVDGHDQPVLDGHARHLVHHVGFEDIAVLGRPLTAPCAGEEFLGVGPVQLEGQGGAHPVVCGHRAMLHEVAAAVFHRPDIPGVTCRAVTGGPDQAVDVLHPAGVRNVDVGIRPEGGDHPAAERAVRGDGGMVLQVIERIIRGGEHLDVEVGEELAWAERRLTQTRLEGIEGAVRRGFGNLLVQLEDVLEFRADPVSGRGSLEQRPRLAELAPHGPWVRVGDGSLVEPVERHAAGMDETDNIVVRGDQQRCRIGERCVLGQHGGVDVAVRGNDRE